jgi:hypothetical protein
MRKPEDGEKKKKNKIPVGILFVGGGFERTARKLL